MIEVRTARPDDVGALRAALPAAFNWDPSRERLPLEHPGLAPYRDGWGAVGDLGVVGEAEGRAVTIGVEPAYRGRGIGTLLLAAPARHAREQGFERLSLSVEPANPARRLYARAGYREIALDPGGSVLMLELR